ncbi:MAG: 1-acyl-sn-glycerol-3-phosphate acyltransferase [Alphaproteobacteria bacterium]|nr:1-acyl-sn-glycerol-3-phosphate acyltransferase [Alphaproteobacteria bacterium]
MTALRSALFNVLFFGATAAVCILGLPVLLLPQNAVLRLSELWTSTTIKLLAITCGLTYEVRGRDRLPPYPVIFAVKHQSAWETLAMQVILRRPVYVVKKELMAIPLFGWYLRGTGQIPIDRRGGAGEIRMMVLRTKAALAGGRPILIFPEGTRAAPGATGTYNPGIAALYKQIGVAVVPVALNSGLYWGRRAFHKRPGTIVVEILPPIPPGLAPRAFLAELESRIEGATRKLEVEGSAGGGFRGDPGR